MRISDWSSDVCSSDLLTTVDISNVDASGIESIDDWLDLLDADTPLTVAHTSGTTGKLSFVPRTKEQWTQTIIHSAIIIRDWFGPTSGPDILKDNMTIILPGYRYGDRKRTRLNYRH